MSRKPAPGVPNEAEIPLRGYARPPALPPSFGAELDAYLRWLGQPGAEQAEPSSAASIAQRRAHLRIAAATLARLHGDPAAVTSLTDLVAPANTDLILSSYLQPTKHRRPIEFVHRLALTLVRVARHWLHVPAEQLDRLVDVQQSLRRGWPLRPGLHSKHRHLLQRLEDPALRARLLALPQVLATRARQSSGAPATRLQVMQTAVAIEILLGTAMTLGELIGLRVRAHLRWPASAEQVLIIRSPASAGNPGRQFEFLGEASALLREYVDRFLPRGRLDLDLPVFCHLNGRALRGSALAHRVKSALRRDVDLDMTPHQFRHFVARVILDAKPGAYGAVKDFLGHNFLQTTLWMYGSPDRREAGRQWNALLDHQLGRLSGPAPTHV